MLQSLINFFKAVVTKYLADDGLSRGAAISFYTATSIAPILLIVVAIAGLVVGEEAARNAIADQISGLMGKQTADLLQSALANASGKPSSVMAGLIGVATLIATASGVFGEMQTALNTIWKAKPDPKATVSRLIRARAVSIGLVASLGFLLLVSLAVSAGLTALSDRLNALVPFGAFLTSVLNFAISFALTATLFAAVFKVLPDTPIAWQEVITGGVITAFLFNGGKALIGWYLGSAAVASTYGAAGGLIILLLWVYYSAQIFLVGAEFTYLYAQWDQPQENKEQRPTSLKRKRAF